MRSLIVTLTLLALAASIGSFETKTVLVRVDGPPLAYAESRLAEFLERDLSRKASLRVELVSADQATGPSFPQRDRDLDSLVAWGTEMGGRYLMLVNIEREELQKRKGWTLPFLFHRWETVGLIEGDYRLVDVARKRILVSEPFSVKRRAKAVFQGYVDNNANDPDIKLSAPDKVRFFAYLEDALAAHLIEQSTALRNGR